MSERNMRHRINCYLKNNGYMFHLQGHEDQNSPGIPDVSIGIMGVTAWVELKHSKAWPMKFKTKLRREQKIWLRRRGRAAGNCFVIHQLGKETILYASEMIASLEGKSREDVIPLSNAHWTGPFDKALPHVLSGNSSQ